MKVFLCFILAIWCLSAGAVPVTSKLKISQKFDHVVMVVFENANFESVLKVPAFAEFAKKGVLFNNFDAEIHDSQGNYIAMVAGSAFNITSDENIDLNYSHIGDLLESKNKNWKIYAENYPGNCYAEEGAGKYVRKHNPFMSFTNVSKNPIRCAKIVNSSEFIKDFQGNTLPEFSLFVPNLDNDGHDTSPDFAGKWFQENILDQIKNSEALQHTLIIATFDENEGDGRNQVYTAMIGPQIVAGTINSQYLNHISLLKMIEDEFSLGNLNREDATAQRIDGIWRK